MEWEVAAAAAAEEDIQDKQTSSLWRGQALLMQLVLAELAVRAQLTAPAVQTPIFATLQVIALL